MILTGYIYTYLYFAFIPFIGLILNKVFKVKTMIIRKSTHIMFSFLWIIMHYYFNTSYHLALIPFSLVLVSLIGYKLDLYKHILSSGEFLGIVYYFLSIFILGLVAYLYPGMAMPAGIGALCLGLGDGFAPIIAALHKSKRLINDKTLLGSLTVFMMSALVVIAFNYFYLTDYNVIKIVVIALVSTTLELFGGKGVDNLYLPLGVAFIAYLLGGF